MNKYQIIKRPLVTEAAVSGAERGNTYAFRVDSAANKTQIKEAVEALYDVKVVVVRTANMPGKPRMYRRAFQSRAPEWKKAYVRLRENDYIDLI
ncbi:MAG: 50S ribosomal protein L23 [Planctomycetota bacterium]|jgi:large subunit ribosomal protein L23